MKAFTFLKNDRFVLKTTKKKRKTKRSFCEKKKLKKSLKLIFLKSKKNQGDSFKMRFLGQKNSLFIVIYVRK